MARLDLSKLTFSSGVCRECKATWDLDRTYSKAEIEAALQTLARCPKCRSIRCSFPYDDPTKASKAAKISAAPTRSKPELVRRDPPAPPPPEDDLLDSGMTPDA